MVFLVAVIVVIVMFTKVVPIFLQMYQNMNVSLPVVTQMIIDISNFLRNEIIIGTILGTTLLSFILIKILIKNSYKTRLKLHNFLLKIPLFGDLLLKINLSKISLVLSTLGDAGVSLVESLEIASNSTNNIVLQNVLFDVRRDVFSGENLSTAFAKHTKTIPSILPSMLLVGEKTGDVEHMFHTIATYYDEEVEESIKRIMALIEPIIIVFLGIVVGTIIVAMYMPMFKMGTLVQ
jgi:type IV pilus assembly protein PilC